MVAGGTTRDRPLLSVDVDVIDAFELDLGDTITLNILGREITAEVRHVRRVEWQGMQLNFALLLSPEPMRRAPHGHVATVRADPDTEAGGGNAPSPGSSRRSRWCGCARRSGGSPR